MGGDKSRTDTVGVEVQRRGGRDALGGKGRKCGAGTWTVPVTMDIRMNRESSESPGSIPLYRSMSYSSGKRGSRALSPF